MVQAQNFHLIHLTCTTKLTYVNGGLDHSLSSDYFVRLTAVYKDGATPISYATVMTITKYLQ